MHFEHASISLVAATATGRKLPPSGLPRTKALIAAVSALQRMGAFEGFRWLVRFIQCRTNWAMHER